MIRIAAAGRMGLAIALYALVAGCSGTLEPVADTSIVAGQSQATIPQTDLSAAAGATRRIKANKPEAVEVDALFTIYERTKARPIDPNAPYDRYLGPARDIAGKFDADKLADETMKSWDGVVSTTMRAGFVKIMTAHLPDVPVNKSINTTHIPGGQIGPIPSGAAPRIHLSNFRIVTELRRERDGWPHVAGNYELRTTGACPFEPGLVEVTQKDFLFQGLRDGKLLFWGALGVKRAFVVANEQRYAAASKDPTTKQISINVPDRASELFEGEVGTKSLTLAGTVHRECTFTLTRKG